MRNIKKALFIILVLALAMCVCVASFAEEGTASQDASNEEKTHYIAEGKCGDGVSYSLDREGVLTIFGNGTMTVSEKESCPWKEYSSEIIEVVIKSGVKSIGRYAFSNHVNLEKITIPDSVFEIGYGAFSGCDKLTVYCGNGSAAETCARAEGIRYEYSDGSSSANGGTEVIIICSVVAGICIVLAAVTFLKMKKNKK